jgi:hypothetical protein
LADHQDVPGLRPAAGEVPLGLAVDLAHQGASGVEVEEIAALRLGPHGLRHAVGGEYDLSLRRHLVQFLDKRRRPGL